MKQLIYEINSKKYLLMQALCTDKEDVLELNSTLEKLNAIPQGIEKMKRGGFFSKPYLLMNVLVPEENIEKFNLNQIK